VRALRAAAALAGVAVLVQGCAGSIVVPNYAAGEEVLRAAPRADAERPAEPLKSAGPIRVLAIATAADEPTYQPRWNPRSAFSDSSGAEGMGAGFLAGLNLVSVLPIFVVAPPILGGIVGLATIAGGVGGATQSGKGDWKPPADSKALETALGRLRADAQVREDFREAVEAITRHRPPLVALPADLAKNEPPDYAAMARSAGADATADLRVVAFGLAGGDASFTVTTFAGVRARVFRASDGGLIYDKLVAQSPDVPLPDAPPPGSYSMDLMALDEGHLFRYEVGQALRAIARALAADPDLHLVPAAASPEPASR
jgi:hypothetical protein